MNAPPSRRPIPYAGFWRRFLASLVDWSVCLVMPIITTGTLILTMGRGTERQALTWLWMPLTIAWFLGYFTSFMSRGRTLGMMASGTRVVDLETGRAPDARKALSRGFLTLLAGACLFLLLATGFSDPPEDGRSLVDQTIIYALTAVVLTGAGGRLWMLVDSKKQTLQDKLTGVAVIRTRPAAQTLPAPANLKARHT